ncbi:uncharacterized protein LOC126259761 [Schistocerca nitens]|uniref:uncharacterized protein LOC126259761 n=1 Tax=Schistocerca nitens TaxID=7011 RepID=UPI002119A75C|nr:uncharacterized protein LOC126259761 [Schistocerca nitens]
MSDIKVRIKLREPHAMEDKHHHLKQRRRTSDTERSHSKLSVRSLSRSSQEREKSDSLLQVLRGVSFGNATTIGRSSLVDVKGPFRSSRDRPPTPVPSVEHLAQEVFKDPPEEEEEDESEIKGKPDYHKLKLERQFAALSRRLIKSVVNKIEACDLRRKIMKPPLPDFKKYHVINKLAERILEDETRISTDSDEFQDAVTVIIQEVIKLYQQQESHVNKL